MEPNSPENPTQARDIPREILSGRTTTVAVSDSDLPFYEDAALQTGFEVEVIAKNRGEYPKLERPPSRREPFTKPDLFEPRSTTVTTVRLAEGKVAIAVRRPGTDKDVDPFYPFWDQASENIVNAKKVR